MLKNTDGINIGLKGTVDSQNATFMTLIKYCKENNIKYIYKEPTKFDKDFFGNLFDINNREKNKEAVDELGIKRDDKGVLDINKIKFVPASKVRLYDDITQRWLYCNLYRLMGDNESEITSLKTFADAITKYCDVNNIKYIYEKPRVYDKEFFGNLFDINNREKNKDLLKEIGCNRNEKGEILVNDMIFSQKRNISVLDGIGSKTFYNYVYRLLIDTDGIETNAGDVDSVISIQKTMKRYFDENKILALYEEGVRLDRGYFDSLFDVKNKEKNKVILGELGRKWTKKGELDIDDMIAMRESKINSLDGYGTFAFCTRIYRLLGYSDGNISGRETAQGIIQEYCKLLGVACLYTKSISFDKDFFGRLLDIKNKQKNKNILDDLGIGRTAEGVINIEGVKFKHEGRIGGLQNTVQSVFYTKLRNCLGYKDKVKVASHGYVMSTEAAQNALIQYCKENNILYKEPNIIKFDKEFFGNFFDINNKDKYKIVFEQLGRKWTKEGVLDVRGEGFYTNGKILCLNVGHVSFYTNIYRQLIDNNGIETGKTGYIENSKNALLVIKRYCDQNNIVFIAKEFIEFDDMYFVDLFDYNKRDENITTINELGWSWTEKGEFNVNSIRFLDSKRISSLDFTMRTFYSKIYRLLGYNGETSSSDIVISTVIEYCKKHNISYIYDDEIKFDKNYYLSLFESKNREKYKDLFLELGFEWSEDGEFYVDNIKYTKDKTVAYLGVLQRTFYNKIYKYLDSTDGIVVSVKGDVGSKESVRNMMLQFCKENNIKVALLNIDNDDESSVTDILNGKTIKEYISLAKIVGWKPMIEILMTQYRSFAGLGIENVEKILGKFLGDSKSREMEPSFEELSVQTLEVVMNSSEISDSIYKSIQNEFVKYIVNYKKDNDYPKCDYQKLYKSWRAEFVKKTKDLQSHIGQTMNNVDKYRNKIINAGSIDSLKSSLGDDDRSFPGFEQWINIISLLEQKRLLVADDMGLGKTGTAIGSIEYLKSKGKIKNALIISPANMMHTWLERLNDGKDGYFIDGKAPRVLVLDGRDKFDENFENYDYILMSSARLSDENAAKVTLQNYDMLVVDEIHEMKNTTSGIWSQNLIKLSDRLSDDSYLLALSGTPIPNKIKDISIMMRLLYPDEFDSVSDRDLVKNIVNQDKLSIGIKYRNKTNRKKLTDWIKMPNKTEKNIYIRQTDLEREISRMIIEDSNLTHSQKLIFLRKLYMCPQSLNPDFDAGSKMIAVADEIISEFKSNKSNIYIVLNDYIDEMIRMDSDSSGDDVSEGYIIDYVRSRLVDAGIDNVDIVSYHGDTSSNDRIQIQEDFNNKNDRKKLLFVSGNAAKVGIDFSGADSIMTYNQPRTLSDMYQQEARVYRVGLDHDIDIYRFIVDDTLESGIYTYTHNKHRAIEKMVENKELMTDAEINMIMSDDIEDTKYHADSDFAYYYSNEKSLLYDMFAINKGVGEERFVANMSRAISGDRTGFDKYADIYNMLGKRSYQGNANRINSQIISLISQKNNITDPKILDLACGNQLLARVSNEELQENILSMDINDKYIDNAFAKTMLDDDGNTRKIKQAIGGITKGSMTKTNLADGSQDFVNLSLAYHYTGLSTSGGKFDRVQSLIEINRVLKIGGICIINEIYSLDFADREYLTLALGTLGFEIVEQFSGNATSVNIKNYSSNILTIRKIGKSERLYDILSDADIKKSVFRGLKFRYNKDSLHSQSYMIDKFDINGRIYNIYLNQSDRNLQNEESKTILLIDSLKSLYGDIMNIPENILHSNGFFSYYDKNKKGRKIRKIARKLSDGSFVFV